MRVFYFKEISSTNDEAVRMAESGAEEGTVVLADSQTNGRGRCGNVWLSPHGGMYASFVLRPNFSSENMYLLGLVLGLAVVRVLRREHLDAVLKWPNDILIFGKKLGGILAEAKTKDKKIDFVVLGLGLNVNTDFSLLFSGATSLYIEDGRVRNIEQLFTVLYDEFLNFYQKIPDKKHDIIREMSIYLSTLGMHIEATLGDSKISGYALSLQDNGQLCVRTEEGMILYLSPGTVTHIRDYEA